MTQQSKSNTKILTYNIYFRFITMIIYLFNIKQLSKIITMKCVFYYLHVTYGVSINFTFIIFSTDDT